MRAVAKFKRMLVPIAGLAFCVPTMANAGAISTNHVATPTWIEVAGGQAATWSEPATASGIRGPYVTAHTEVGISCRRLGFKVADGNRWWYQLASSPWSGKYYVSADPFYNNGHHDGPLHGTPFVDLRVRICAGPYASGTTETSGGAAHTWSDPASAGGVAGPTIPASASILIACKLGGFAVADGNGWWYRIASAPWSGKYYVSADPFYNNGRTSGLLKGTPFVDQSVPMCNGGTPPTTTTTTTTIVAASGPVTEWSGTTIHTWTNYTNAGGIQGPSISPQTSVSVSCRRTGFAVADGDTWWYQIASSPWNGTYWASADSFYNNGATSGSLAGTPYVDPAVPTC